jgi:hypothetical protein
MEMDRDDFNLSPVFFARAYCRFCRREHEWFAQEAWVCDSPTPRAQALADAE